MMIKRIIVCLFLFASLGMIAAIPMMENQVNILAIREPDTSDFPNMSVNFRAVSQSGLVIDSIEKRQLNVLENGNSGSILSLEKQQNGVGLNLYIVIDEYNRTDPELVSEFISRFASRFMIENLDQLTIITNNPISIGRDNRFVSLSTTTSRADLLSFAASHTSQRNFQYINQALFEAYSIAVNDNLSKSHSSHIILLAGPETILNSTATISEIREYSLSTRIPLHVFEIEHPSIGFRDSQLFRDLAEGGQGSYYQILQSDKKTQDFTALDDRFFSPITNERLSYTLLYRSVIGDVGNRDVILNVAGLNLSDPTRPTFSYSIDLQPVAINFNKPLQGAKIVRTAQQDLSDRFLYDQDVQKIEFTIDWPDQYPRDFSSIRLQINSPAGIETINLPTESKDGIYQFDWDLRNIIQEGDNPVDLTIQMTDELGVQNRSETVSVLVSNVIPLGIKLRRANILVYGLALLVVVLFVMLFVMRNKIKNIDLRAIGSAIVTQVRKTFLPNKGKQNPIAFLSIISGPENMIGEKLEIFTESVKLGRDPAQADFVFFSPESKSTISGLHAEIRCQNHQWLIENYSSSGETILNGIRIDDDRPTFIHSGDKVRLGFLAQQSVEFEFLICDDNQFGDSDIYNDNKQFLEVDNVLSEQVTELPDGQSTDFTQMSNNPSELDKTQIEVKSKDIENTNDIGDIAPDEFFSQFDD